MVAPGYVALGRTDPDCRVAVAGAIGVLQSHVPQQQQPSASGFQYSAFSAAAQAPQMDALEMQLASMQGMPGYGTARLAVQCPKCGIDVHSH